MKSFIYFVVFCLVILGLSSAKPGGYNKRQEHQHDREDAGKQEHQHDREDVGKQEHQHDREDVGKQEHPHLTSASTALYKIKELRSIMDDEQLAKFVRQVSYLNCGDDPNNQVYLESQGTEGTIESPGYPDEYPTFTLCDYLIIGNPGSKIKLEFEDFDVEAGEGGVMCNWDYVAIYDGMSSEHDKLAQLCGPDKPEPITSTGPALYIKFKSDEAINKKGFKIKYIFE